jgi:DNA-binding NarL/FixJ family response regulator
MCISPTSDAKAPTCILAARHDAIRKSLALLLAHEGFAVVGEATTGRQAVLLLDEFRPLLAVLDLRLVDMTGIEVARKARRLGVETAIVLHTGWIGRSTVQEALEAGVNAIAVKAVPPGALLDALAAVVSGETYVDPAIGYRSPGSAD